MSKKNNDDSIIRIFYEMLEKIDKHQKENHERLIIIETQLKDFLPKVKKLEEIIDGNGKLGLVAEVQDTIKKADDCLVEIYGSIKDNSKIGILKKIDRFEIAIKIIRIIIIAIVAIVFSSNIENVSNALKIFFQYLGLTN